MRWGFVIGLAVLAASGWARASELAVVGARGVLSRLIGSRAAAFEFRVIPKVGKLDVFEFEAHDGRVQVAGSSGVAMARGAYEYLKSRCGIQVTWDGDQLRLPALFPDAPRQRTVCPNEFRHYFNVCTFGYTTVFWDWKRWRREIDWMALHGINMPLAMNGQERVWLDVWRDMGFSEAEILKYFTGPAFLPWFRMGNVNSTGGPMPKAWLDQDAAMQKRILAAETELGMTPVTPAFAGFVPPSFDKRFPSVKVTRSSGWCNFDPTYQLDARDPMFRTIGAKFIQAYRKRFGSAGLYLADVFNEMSPQVSKDHKLDDLKATGQAIYESILAGDPAGTWVSQGWLFYNERGFWGDPEVAAYLSAVPDERMILLDLAGDEYEVWRIQPAFRKKRYVWNLLHNYGQNTRLFGDFGNVVRRASGALNDPKHGGLVGMGLTMEGTQQNTPVYELMLDQMWQSEPINTEAWLKDWANRRYGTSDPMASEIWRGIRGLFYDGFAGAWMKNAYQTRPSESTGDGPTSRTEQLRALVELMLRASPELKRSELFRRDLVDVAKAYFGDEISGALSVAVEASLAKDAAASARATAHFGELMEGLDALLATVPQHRMDRWIAAARASVSSTQDKDRLEQDARLQVTVWGGPVLFDYAAKEWSGLVNQFYRPRWERYLAQLQAGKPSDSAEWELNWCDQKSLIPPAKVDPFSQTRKLLDLSSKRVTFEVDRGIAVGKPVTSGGRWEQDHAPSAITDGRSTGGYWAASGPQSVTIDLLQPTPVESIQVFPYVDGRYYRYTVEVSEDGQNWSMVADLSRNDASATRRGTTHPVAKKGVRFVRVNMLFNSANPSVHLHEVRVFGPKTSS